MNNFNYDYSNDPTAQKLYNFLHRWINSHLGWQYENATFSNTYRNVQDIANEFLSEVEFVEINLAGLLNGPNGALIQTVVSWLLPYPMNMESRLLFDAIMLAARAKQRNERRMAALLSFGALILLVLMASLD